MLGMKNHQEDSKYLKKKQAPSAFVLFCRDYRKRICMQCPFLSPPDVSKVLSERWRSLAPNEKERYREKAFRASFVDEDGVSNCSFTETQFLEPNYNIKKNQFSLLPSIETFKVPHIFDSLERIESLSFKNSLNIFPLTIPSFNTN